MRSAAPLEPSSGGIRAPRDAYSFFELTGPQLLLQAATAAASSCAALLALRSCGLLDRTTAMWAAGGPLALLAATTLLRVPLRELLRSLGPRERASLVFVHLALLLFPLAEPDTRFLALALTSVQLPMLLLLLDARQYVRLQAVQLVVVLVAAMTDPADDLASLALTTGFLGALVVQSFALRVATVAEAYLVTPWVTPASVVAAVGPTLLLLVAVAVAHAAMLDGRDFAGRPSWSLPRAAAGPQGGWASGSSAGGLGRLAASLVVATAALIAAAYLLDKLRDALEKRRRAREMELDYAVAAFEPDAPAASPAPPRARPTDARRRLVAAYLRLLERAGRQRGARGAGQTAAEFEEALARTAAGAPARDAVAPLRPAFEGARYGAEEPDAGTLAAYERAAAAAEAALAALPEAHRPPRR